MHNFSDLQLITILLRNLLALDYQSLLPVVLEIDKSIPTHQVLVLYTTTSSQHLSLAHASSKICIKAHLNYAELKAGYQPIARGRSILLATSLGLIPGGLSMHLRCVHDRDMFVSIVKTATHALSNAFAKSRDDHLVIQILKGFRQMAKICVYFDLDET